MSQLPSGTAQAGFENHYSEETEEEKQKLHKMITQRGISAPFPTQGTQRNGQDQGLGRDGGDQQVWGELGTEACDKDGKRSGAVGQGPPLVPIKCTIMAVMDYCTFKTHVMEKGRGEGNARRRGGKHRTAPQPFVPHVTTGAY